MFYQISVFCLAFFLANTSQAASMSKWDKMLKEANQNEVYECVFPDAYNVKAPDWICSRFIAGAEVSAVGSGKYIEPAKGKEERYVEEHKGSYRNYISGPIKAYLNALIKVKMEQDVRVKMMVKEFLKTTGSDPKENTRKSNDILKGISQLKSLSGDSVINSMTKSYVETHADGVNKVSSIIRKMVYSTEDCQFIYKTYKESQTTGDKTVSTDVADSNVHRGSCGFGDLVSDMESSGYRLMKIAKSPNDQYYVLVGVASVSSNVDHAIKNSLSNDRKLWQEFKKSKQ